MAFRGLRGFAWAFGQSSRQKTEHGGPNAIAYIVLFLCLAVWACFALRGGPLRHYARVYFTGGLLAYVAQFTLSGVFHFYRYRSYIFLDPFHDERLMGFFVLLGIDPLFVVLYARYCRKRPVLMAFLFAGLISLCEVIFAWIGAMTYPVGWGPLLSFLVSVPAFLVVWRIAIKAIPIPYWFEVNAVAFWAAAVSDTLLHGALWLYHYRAPAFTGDPRVDSRILALLYNAFVQAPLSTYAVLRPRRQRVLACALALCALMGIEIAGRATGIIQYDGWNLVLAFLYYLAGIVAPGLYHRWMSAPARAPQWEPPVWPRSHKPSGE